MSPRSSTISRLAPFFVVGAVALSFLPVLGNGWIGNWDDGMFLLDNTRFRGLAWANIRWMFTGAFIGGHYEPVTWLSYAVDHLLWGLNPAGYHATSLALHAVNASLFYFIARRLLDSAYPSEDHRTAALVAALLHFLHPMRVEPVAWAADRRDVLAGFFYLGSVLIYLRAPARGEKRLLWLSASCAAFALSLLSKAVGIALPFVLLVLDWYPLRRLGDRAQRAPAIIEKAPYLMLSIGAAFQAAAAQNRIETLRPLATYDVVERVSQAAYGLAFYLAKTVLPIGISPFYEIPARWDPLAPRFLLAGAAVVMLAAAAAALRRRYPGILAAGLCYALTLAPVLGLVLTGYQLAADRYSYLACLGWPLLAAPALARRRFLAGAALALLGALSWRQCGFWHDPESLWGRAVAIEPDSVVANINYGTTLGVRRATEEAIARYQKALSLNPICVETQDKLMAVLDEPARAEEAARLKEVLKVNPACRRARTNLITAKASLGRDLPEAASYYRQLLALGYREPGLYGNLGRALRAQGLKAAAEEAFRQDRAQRQTESAP